MRKITTLLSAIALAFTFFAVAPQSANAQKVVHKVAIHVDDSDPKKMNLALNNVENIRKYYDSVGEEVIIEVVTYGPGLNMLRADKSPVADRIATMSLQIDNLVFAACGNTRSKMAKKEGKEIPLIAEAKQVPSGVVRLIELQEKGYAYVRP